MNQKISKRTVDLFCGCGGMSLGFQNSGFDIIAAFDNWDPAIDVYKDNFEHQIVKGDLSDSSVHKKIIELKPDIIIGGPPCQDFSQAGYRDENKGRAILSECFAEIVVKSSCSCFVMENVPEIFKSETYKKVESIFKNNGFGLTKIVIDANFCNCPQKRKRAFTIGVLNEKDNFLYNDLVNNQNKIRMTVFDYLGNKLGTEFYFRVPRSYKRRGVFSIYEPSPTIRGVERPIPKGYKTLPNDPAPVEQSRVLTPKERSLIQTFPESFKFKGSKNDLNQMIGNAVPVNLAAYVARILMSYLNEKN